MNRSAGWRYAPAGDLLELNAGQMNLIRESTCVLELFPCVLDFLQRPWP